MPTLDVSQLKVWAHQAGQIALRHFKKAAPQRKADQSFLTQADLEIEDFLTERLRAAYPDHALIGEEGTSVGHNYHSPNIWAIDPLDGTTSFVQGLPGWGISIGLLHRGQPHFGLFYMPLLDDLSYAINQDGVYNNEYNIQGTVRSTWGHKGFLAISASAHRDFQIGVERTRTLGSAGASLAYTARGAAAAAFIPKAHLWDLVSGAAILIQAGGELRYLSGHPVDYLALLDGQLAPEPILAGQPGILAELQKCIKKKIRGNS